MGEAQSMQESSLHYSTIDPESPLVTLLDDPWIIGNSHQHEPKKCHFYYLYQYLTPCSPLRTVCLSTNSEDGLYPEGSPSVPGMRSVLLISRAQRRLSAGLSR